jgi:di/tricarboxylate transporter
VTGARRRHELERQREARRRSARETQAAQARATARRDLQRRTRHRVEGAVLVSLAIVIAVAHLFEHSGSLVLMSQGLEDLLIGFPTAALLAIIGLVRLGT